ncbi:DUF6262 family protein [Streptomyces decoyicus]|uniref:DUF6262 family protein n=1 Tax=Streptomyces decoyicus TaxID=249567 RepID=UPI0038646269|nr:DUF6262 family protein [Streptomyces decoyicus]
MNTAGVPEPRTAAALAARRRRTEAALARVHQAIARLRREKAQVSVAAVARRADVSRTFRYDNVEARATVAARSNPRFQDRSVAGLEARIAEPAPKSRSLPPNHSTARPPSRWTGRPMRPPRRITTTVLGQ